MRKEYYFSKMKKAAPKYTKYLKEPITIRLNPLVLQYFKALSKKTGLSYQSLIDYVLNDYAKHGLEPTANWGKLDSRIA